MISKHDVPPEFFQHYPGMTSCAACDELVKRTEVVVVTRHITDFTTDVEHFCSQACADTWRETFHAEE